MHNYNSDEARSYSLQEAAYGVSKWQRICQHFKLATKVKTKTAPSLSTH